MGIFCNFFLTQPMIDSWRRRGLGGEMVIPPLISPATLILLYVVCAFNASVEKVTQSAQSMYPIKLSLYHCV
ncbi:hypothetical protein GYMLUDRAFT_766973 [Collybiopsis luxurians FD-317 M1]|uniref:Uncharacterized protein n=1 Tax=Collybiopsis luxurians FD-317 M1 TaxID=944289 RepID=A0A0D0BQ83_9AGAR|nr:hypothetical protein GYMLUDRAFT_766973 [Collybiopsis luxurians FD-317 M1]